MTTTHEALDASLAALQPNHLPESAWAAEAEEVVTDYSTKSLPAVPGRPFGWNLDPRLSNPVW